MQIRHLFLKPTSSQDGVRLSGIDVGLNIILAPDDQNRGRLVAGLHRACSGPSRRPTPVGDCALEIAWDSKPSFDDPGSPSETGLETVWSIPRSLFCGNTSSSGQTIVSVLQHPMVAQLAGLSTAPPGSGHPRRVIQAALTALSDPCAVETRLLRLCAERQGLLSRIQSIVQHQHELHGRLQKLRNRCHALEDCWRRTESRQPLILQSSESPNALTRWRIRMRQIRQCRTRIARRQPQATSDDYAPKTSSDMLCEQLRRLRLLCHPSSRLEDANGAWPVAARDHRELVDKYDLSQLASVIDHLLDQSAGAEKSEQLVTLDRHLSRIETYARRKTQELLRAESRRAPQQSGDLTTWCRGELAQLHKRSTQIEQRLQGSPQFQELPGLCLQLLEISRQFSVALGTWWSAVNRWNALPAARRMLWSIELLRDIISARDQTTPVQPLVFDDPLDTFLRSDITMVARRLVDLAGSNGQIIYFTSCPEIAELLEHGGARIVSWQTVPATARNLHQLRQDPVPLASDNHRSGEASLLPSSSKSHTADSREAETQEQFLRVRHCLTLASSISDCPSIDSRLANRFAEFGIETAQDLLDLRPDEFAVEASELGLGPIALFAIQSQVRLMCQIPMLDRFAARCLVQCGLTNPRQVAEQDAEHLLRSVMEVLHKHQNDAVSATANRQEVLRETGSWIRRARHSRSLWELQRDPVVGTVVAGIRGRSGLGRSVTRGFLASGRSIPTGVSIQTARTEPEIPVEQIPGIEPAQARGLHRLDIHTVQQLIEADPTLTADRCAEWGGSLELIKSWRRRGLLTCQLPGLNPESICLLDACGIDSVTSLAAADVEDLWTRLRGVLNEQDRDNPQSSAADRAVKPVRTQVVEWIEQGRIATRRDAA